MTRRFCPQLILLPILLLLPGGTVFPREGSAGEEKGGAAPLPREILVSAPAPDDTAVGTPGRRIIIIDEVRREGDLTLADILGRTRGITIQHLGSGFEPTAIRIRGSDAGQVLILRDGVPLGDGRNSTADLSRISLFGVESVEIFLGPATAVFGIGGAAGAINLISRDTDATVSGPAGLVRGSWGSTGEYRMEGGAFLYEGKNGLRTVLDIQASGVLSRNSYSYTRNNIEETRANAGGTEGNMRFSLEKSSPAHLLRLDGAASAFRKGVPGTVEFPASSAEMTEEKVSLSLRGSRKGPWLVAGEAGISRSDRSYRDPDYPLGPQASDSRLTAAWTKAEPSGVLGPFFVTFPLLVRGEFLEDTQSGVRDRAVLSPAFSARAKMPGWTGSKGEIHLQGRLEIPLADGGEVLPSFRLALGRVLLGKAVWWGTAVSAGYRLPDFSELFMEDSAFIQGNPDLVPEKSRAMEGEFRWGTLTEEAGSASANQGGPGFRAAVHLTGYRDLIQWLPDPNGYWRPRNTGNALIGGLELEISLSQPLGLSPWNISGAAGGELLYALDRNKGITMNKQLPYRPRLMFHAEAALRHLWGHRISLNLEGQGARPVTRQNSLWADPYLNISLGGTAVLVPGVTTLEVRVRNLLDHEFLETRFYPNPGREIRIAVEVKK